MDGKWSSSKGGGSEKFEALDRPLSPHSRGVYGDRLKNWKLSRSKGGNGVEGDGRESFEGSICETVVGSIDDWQTASLTDAGEWCRRGACKVTDSLKLVSFSVKGLLASFLSRFIECVTIVADHMQYHLLNSTWRNIASCRNWPVTVFRFYVVNGK
jgi:hypothetical protein